MIKYYEDGVIYVFSQNLRAASINLFCVSNF